MAITTRTEICRLMRLSLGQQAWLLQASACAAARADGSCPQLRPPPLPAVPTPPAPGALPAGLCLPVLLGWSHFTVFLQKPLACNNPRAAALVSVLRAPRAHLASNLSPLRGNRASTSPKPPCTCLAPHGSPSTPGMGDTSPGTPAATKALLGVGTWPHWYQAPVSPSQRGAE